MVITTSLLRKSPNFVPKSDKMPKTAIITLTPFLQAAVDAISSMNLFDLGGQYLRVGRAITPPDTTNQVKHLKDFRMIIWSQNIIPCRKPFLIVSCSWHKTKCHICHISSLHMRIDSGRFGNKNTEKNRFQGPLPMLSVPSLPTTAASAVSAATAKISALDAVASNLGISTTEILGSS
jgi:hypothetical protein